MQREVYEFISKTTNDRIIERRTCKRTGQEFPIFQEEKKLLDKISPVVGGKKFNISLPNLSPEARGIRRLMFRNERKFYKFIDSKGKTQITTIAPDMGFEVISQEKFFENDNTGYGIEYSGDLGNDLKKLFTNMPYPAKLCHNMENADYCNQETDDKNCYLNTGGHHNENSMYNTYSLKGKRTVDNYWVLNSEQIYQSINIHKSQKVLFSKYIEGGYNILFSYDLMGCQNMILCHGLRNANYAYKDKILPKEEREEIHKLYKQKISSYSGFMEVIKEYEEFVGNKPRKSLLNVNAENSIGAELKNVQNNFIVNSGEESQDIMYAAIYAYIKDCMDVESFGWGEKAYNVASSVNVSNSITLSHIFDTFDNGSYSYLCKNVAFLTGCIGLNHKKYCVLNKQYSQDEREKVTTEILEKLQDQNKLGEFFDPELSPFPYNDTVAIEYYPVKPSQLTILEPDKFISDAILDLGGEEKIKIKRRTREQEVNILQGIQTVQAQDLPDNIVDVDDSLLDKAIICKASRRPFRIVKLELDFYRKHGLPIPRKHPDIRHLERIKSRPSRELYLRKCDKCNQETLSVFQGDGESKIYCEACYNKEVYG